MEGEITAIYSDGREESTSTGDLFYWPPGHAVKAERDAEVILFSPQAEHCLVVDRLRKQLVG